VHDPDEAARVTSTGAVDYIIFGTVFDSASKAPGHTRTGLDGLAAAAAAARPVPVLAIGGVSAGTAPAIESAGAAGIAGIGLFLPGEPGGEPTIAATVHRLRPRRAGHLVAAGRKRDPHSPNRG
jgi:thiamine-phosphate pyrophosphorylase